MPFTSSLFLKLRKKRVSGPQGPDTVLALSSRASAPSESNDYPSARAAHDGGRGSAQSSQHDLPCPETGSHDSEDPDFEVEEDHSERSAAVELRGPSEEERSCIGMFRGYLLPTKHNMLAVHTLRFMLIFGA
jgi:hypothetical protein